MSVTARGIVDHVNGIASTLDQERANKENRFPIEVLPDPFRSFIQACQYSLNMPIDYTATAVITAASATVGKGARIKVRDKWYEFPAMYAAIIGSPGANKSHPLAIATAPLIDIDKKNVQLYADKLAAYDRATKEKKAVDDNFNEVEKPVLKKIIINNATPEVQDQRMADNERGCLLYSDELATWIRNINQYNKGDQSSKYLSIWSSKSYSVDRVKTPIPIVVSDPFLSIIGSTQPNKLKQLFAGNIDNGLLQRFLFAFPNYSDKQPINDNEFPDDIMNAYNEWVLTFEKKHPIAWDVSNNKWSPKTFCFSPQAKEYFHNWQAANCAKVNEFTDSVNAEVYTKFDMHFPRLALILQCMTNFEGYQVELQAVQGAASLCQYYMNCADKVLDIIIGADYTVTLPENKKRFIESLPGEFTKAGAVMLGESHSLNEKAVSRFLKDDKFFVKLSHGKYSKKE